MMRALRAFISSFLRGKVIFPSAPLMREHASRFRRLLRCRNDACAITHAYLIRSFNTTAMFLAATVSAILFNELYQDD